MSITQALRTTDRDASAALQPNNALSRIGLRVLQVFLGGTAIAVLVYKVLFDHPLFHGLLFSLVVFPGLFWIFILGYVISRVSGSANEAYRHKATDYLRECSRKAGGQVDCVDVGLVDASADAIGIAHHGSSTLFVLRAGHFQAIPWTSVVGWQVVQGHKTAVFGAPRLELEAARADRAANMRSAGIFLTLSDRSDPLVHLRIFDAAACNRWAAIFDGLDATRATAAV